MEEESRSAAAPCTRRDPLPLHSEMIVRLICDFGTNARCRRFALADLEAEGDSRLAVVADGILIENKTFAVRERVYVFAPYV